MLTTFGLDTYVYEALRAGASGFMLKDAHQEDIVAGVRIVANVEALLAPAVTRSVIEEFVRRDEALPPAPPTVLDELTPRERKVLDGEPGLDKRGEELQSARLRVFTTTSSKP